MKQESKDETRWLLRLLAVILVGLGIQGVRVQLSRISAGEDFSAFSFILFIGVVLLLFWLAYRLWRYTSFWDIFSWMQQTPPLFLYCQCQYFRLNQHVRCGFIAGLILLFLDKVIFVLPILYKGVAFWESARYLWMKVIWPPRRCFEILHLFESPLVMFLVFCIYVFTIGFIVGWCVSYLKERFIRDKEINDMYRSQDAESSSCGD